MNGVTAVTPFILFSYHLTPEVTGHIRDMYPPAVALPNQLGEAYLPSLQHLLYEFEQTTMVGLVARDEVGCTSEDVVTVLHATHECIEFLAAVT